MARASLFNKLSLKAQAEIDAIVNNKENAIDLIVNTFYGNANATASDISARFQVQYFAEDPNLNTLQEDGKDGWWQNESYEGNEINSALFPIVETETTEDEWGKKYYSSFAVKYNGPAGRIKYPLDDDFTSTVSPFANFNISDLFYKEVVRNVQNKFGIKIVNGKASTLSLYKRNLLSLAATKIKNAGLRLTKRLDLVQDTFKGKLILANETKGGYKYNNIEKIVKVYDSIFKIGINRQVKYFNSKNKKTINKDLKFASRLFANVLMSRITYYGDTKVNKRVEKCLSLQLANVLNNSSFTPAQIKQMTQLASSTVAAACAKMGYTKEKIVSCMTINGYQYPKVPQDITEAILLAHQRDYSYYKTNVVNTTLETEHKTDYGIIASEDLYKLIKPLNELKAADKKGENVLKSPEKKAKLESGIKGYLETTKLPVPAPERGLAIVGESTEGDLSGNKKFIDRFLDKYGKFMDKVLNPQQDDEKLKLPFKREVKVLPPRKITEKQFKKLIDQYVEDVLAGQVVKVTNAINANRCGRYGGKENAKNLAYISSMTTCFYKKTPLKITKASIKNYATIYSRSRQFSSLLIEKRNKIAQDMSELSSQTVRQVGENKPAFINRLARQLCKAGDETGLTLKQYFENLIKAVSSIYASGNFEDIHDNKKA